MTRSRDAYSGYRPSERPAMSMGAPAAAADGRERNAWSGVSALDVERRAVIDAGALCVALADPAGWLGASVDPPMEHPELRRVETDLVYPLSGSGRSVAFRKAALVDIGVFPGDTGCVAAIAWRAASFAPLFPSFAGRLHVEPTGLRLTGYYAPPAGGAGLVVDRVFLHHVARRTAEWFLDRLALEASMPPVGPPDLSNI